MDSTQPASQAVSSEASSPCAAGIVHASYTIEPLGIRICDVTSAFRRELRLPSSTRGVVVLDVNEISRASEAGVRCGDIIAAVNRRPVTCIAEFEQAVLDARAEPLLLMVRRQGHTRWPVIGAL